MSPPSSRHWTTSRWRWNWPPPGFASSRRQRLSERLDRALPLLVGGARDRPERQRTLRATIDWSAQLLSDQERDLLLRLAVFRSGFSLDAAEWMCEGPSTREVRWTCSQLSSRAAWCKSRTGGRVRGSRCSRRSGSMRGTSSNARGDLRKCRQRHAEFFSGLAVRAEPHLIGAGQSAWIATLRDEFEDIRAAVDHYLSTGAGRRCRRSGLAALLVLVDHGTPSGSRRMGRAGSTTSTTT